MSRALEFGDPGGPCSTAGDAKGARSSSVVTTVLARVREKKLSHSRTPYYSFVVKTTESVARPEVTLPDGDDADQLIIQRVLAGHRDAFRVLISRYSDPLYRHARCMTGSTHVAE